MKTDEQTEATSQSTNENRYHSAVKRIVAEFAEVEDEIHEQGIECGMGWAANAHFRELSLIESLPNEMTVDELHACFGDLEIDADDAHLINTSARLSLAFGAGFLEGARTLWDKAKTAIR